MLLFLHFRGKEGTAVIIAELLINQKINIHVKTSFLANLFNMLSIPKYYILNASIFTFSMASLKSLY